jgi:glycosyltransferase involved in cell wall biosynthesis
VLLSDLPAHRESLGDGARYFPATDSGRLAREMRALLDDHEGRAALARRGGERVSRLSWDAAAHELRDVVRGALDR